jgi:hypothetical protein
MSPNLAVYFNWFNIVMSLRQRKTGAADTRCAPLHGVYI